MIEQVKVWYRDTDESMHYKEDCPDETFHCRARKRDGNLLRFTIADGETFININVLRKIKITKVHTDDDDCDFLRE